jgi:chitin synthase
MSDFVLAKFSSWFSRTCTLAGSWRAWSCNSHFKNGSDRRSMGNRPQGTKLAYKATAIFFAILMAYLLFCSAWLTYKGVQSTLATLHSENQKFGQNFGVTVNAVFSNRLFRDLILSTLSTYGLYLISSLMFFDATHMVTCFIQYLLFSPSYINILYTRCV